MTEKGKALAKSISELGNQIQFAADKNITEEELSSFYNTLEKLSENLSEISQFVDVSCKDSVSNTMKTE